MKTYVVGDAVTLIEGISGVVLAVLDGGYKVRTYRGVEYVNTLDAQPWPAEAP